MNFDNPKFNEAIDRIEQLFILGTPLFLGFSGGKDSSLLLALTLIAARNAKEKGATPYLVTMNSDTGVENAEITTYLKTESKKITAYAKQHGINLEYHTAYPVLNDTWAVSIISGRKLPSFPTTNGDCAISLKVKPMNSLRRKLMKETAETFNQEVVTLVGTRLSESSARATKMKNRNETHLSATRNKDGDWVYPVIANFETEDVWEFIGLVRSNLVETYSDFDDLTRIYASAGNTSCAVVSDAITEGLKTQRGSCSARTGCMICEKVAKDSSLEAMIESDADRYGYMTAPNQLRNFIANTQWDLSRRNWVGKTINQEGQIAIRPDTYSPAMCLELLRYALTIDVQEREQAYMLGLDEARFELVPIDALVAIDAIWSLQGLHKPFQAMMTYFDIVEKGQRYPVPDIAIHLRQAIPTARYISVPDKHKEAISVFDGLRDPLLEIHADSHCMSTRTTGKGKTVMDVEQESSFTVDVEGVFLAIEFERDTMTRIHRSTGDGSRLTQGYKWWARMGTISLSPQQVSIHDDILKRTVIKEALGIAGPNVTKEQLLAMSDAPSPPKSLTRMSIFEVKVA